MVFCCRAIVRMLAAASLTWGGAQAQAASGVDTGANAAPAAMTAPLGKGDAPPSFSSDELAPFLAAVKTAEAVTDPLARCLAYPDPPGSHWSRDAVEAYCRYRTQQTPDFNELKALIEAGNSAEVDRRFAELQRAGMTEADRRGALEHAFAVIFSDATPERRAMVDAWKALSPDSGFAWAASGYLYVREAEGSSGMVVFRNGRDGTSSGAMDELLKKGVPDLQKAVKLDQSLIPAYGAMIDAARMRLMSGYALRAGQVGLAIDPNNYQIYAKLVNAFSPVWHDDGFKSMENIIADAQKHAQANPLLVLLQNDARYEDAELWKCSCKWKSELSKFRWVFDQISSVQKLYDAGVHAQKIGQPTLAVVYLSESIRFGLGDDETLSRRAQAITTPGVRF